MRKKLNFPLIFGFIVLILLFAMSFFPKLFTANDPIFEHPTKYIEVKVDGEIKEQLATNPIQPNKDNLMGTDDAGRDIYARIVYGTRNTMKLVVLIAIIRMLLAFPIGILAGIKVKFFSFLIKFLNTFFSSVPILILSFFIFNFTYFERLQIDKAIIIYAVVLGFLGFAKLSSIIEDQTKIIMNEDFIEGEVAIGKTKGQIIIQNIIPHLIPTSISLFFKEIASALFLIAQLAVLSTFVGTVRFSQELAFRSDYLMGFEPEWGGMLTKIGRDVQNLDKIWWPTVFPILIFTISILGLNMLGEGLREEFEKRDSRVITLLRRMVTMLSPKVLFLEMKSFKTHKKPVLIKLSAIALILIYIVVPKYKSLYDFNTENVFSYAQTLSGDEFEGRLTGTEGSYQAGNLILEELESFGFTTESHIINQNEIDENDILSLDSLTPLFVEEGVIRVETEDGKTAEFSLYEDFELFTLNRDELVKFSGEEKLVYKATAIAEDELSQRDADREIIPIFDYYLSDLYRDNGIDQINSLRTKDGTELNFQVAIHLPHVENNRASTNLHRYHSIVPKGELLELLVKGGEIDMEVEFSYPKIPSHEARNIIGFLPAKDTGVKERKETIIIGASYDGLHTQQNEDFGFMSSIPASIGLELAREMGKFQGELSKNIMFIFWDNEFEINKRTIMQGAVKFNEVDRRPIDLTLDGGYVYFDIGYPGFENEIKELPLVTFPAQMGKEGSYHVGNTIENSLKKSNVKYRRYQNIYSLSSFATPYGRYEIASRALFNMRLNSNLSVGFGSAHIYDMYTEKDKLENIDEDKVQQIGQAILDALTMNEYLMGEPASVKKSGK